MAKILVIDDNTELLETLGMLLGQRGAHETVLSADGTDGLNKALADPPDLVICDVMMPSISGYEICRQLRANPSTASTPIIILTARGQPVDYQAALEAGADEHMVKPVVMDELLERVNSLLAERSHKEPSKPAWTIVLLSLRGGVGVTTVVVNLAATLAQAGSGSAVCLADLCPSSGHVALQLGLRPEPNWSDLAQVGTLNEEAVKAHLLQHTSGLQVLASPIFPIVGQGLSQAMVQTTLTILRRQFATTIVDTPPVLDEATMVILEAATIIGLVMTAEAPSIQAAVGTLRALKRWSNKFQIILNQVAPGSQTPTTAIERALKRSPAGTIPFDPAQARALTQGVPLALDNPTSPLAQATRGLAQELGRQAMAIKS